MNSHKSKIHVLLVDDKEENLVAHEAVLGDLGLHLIRARSGREALRCLLSQDFAAILLDVNMPGMDGFETASLIRQRKSSEGTPIIFVTAHGDEPSMAKGYALGAVDYILTPVIPHVLRAKIAVFVELYRKTQEVRSQADKLQHRANQLAALAGELAQAEQRERRRLAQTLHDNLQQLLVAARMRLAALQSHSKNGKATIIAQVDDLINKSINVSRSLTVQLSPPVLYDIGLIAALEWLARQMKEHHGLAVDVLAEDSAELVNEQVRVFAFHAVRELVFNVVKHADVKEATITVSRSAENCIQIVVEDSGAGFDPVALEAKRNRSEHFGLFSISERAQLLNGRLIIQSACGGGTRVNLELPDTGGSCDTDESSHSETGPEIEIPLPLPIGLQDASDISAQRGPKIRVVLADDHEMMRKGLAALFENYPDIEVIGEAIDGPNVILVAQQLRPDVIVMDISMPGMSGIEATRLIKEKYPGIRIIGLSMHHQEDMAAAMRRAGACAFLTKGGPPEALIAEIRNLGEPISIADAAMIKPDATPQKLAMA